MRAAERHGQGDWGGGGRVKWPGHRCFGARLGRGSHSTHARAGMGRSWGRRTYGQGPTLQRRHHPWGLSNPNQNAPCWLTGRSYCYQSCRCRLQSCRRRFRTRPRRFQSHRWRCHSHRCSRRHHRRRHHHCRCRSHRRRRRCRSRSRRFQSRRRRSRSRCCSLLPRPRPRTARPRRRRPCTCQRSWRPAPRWWLARRGKGGCSGTPQCWARANMHVRIWPQPALPHMAASDKHPHPLVHAPHAPMHTPTHLFALSPHALRVADQRRQLPGALPDVDALQEGSGGRGHEHAGRPC